MNYKMIGKLISMILAIEAVFMLPAVGFSAIDRDFETTRAFLLSILIISVIAVPLYILCRKSKSAFYAKEGLVCVSAGWIMMCLAGALPFFFSAEIPRFIDALFEIVSGFTTTGASVLPDVESLSRGILYWRSFSHWLGGMGVLVFVLAVVPTSGRSDGFTLHILRAESPGPNVGKLVPRMRTTALILYLIYVCLTLIDFIFLIIGKMPAFEALCTALGTAGTGGFGVKNDSIASYSPYIQNVCTVFMLLFGVNFTCYYLLLLRQLKNVFKDRELRVYIGVIISSTALIAINIRGLYSTVEEVLRHSFFQVASITTTTGFASTDFDKWPSFSKAIILTLMAVGACAGSTGGGMKWMRVMLLFKTLRRNIKKVIHPQNVQVVKVGKQVVQEKILENTGAYLSAYVFILVFSFIVISLDNFSVMTNFSAVLSCMNNIGPGLDAVGPTCNYAGYSILSKLVLIFDMLAGRLEIFPMLALFSGGLRSRG